MFGFADSSAFDQDPQVIHEQVASEQQEYDIHDEQHDAPVFIRPIDHQRRKRKHESENGQQSESGVSDVMHKINSVDYQRIKRRRKHVRDEHKEVSVVIVTDAAAEEVAVVVALKNAHLADGAVPRSRRTHPFAFGAEAPVGRRLRKSVHVVVDVTRSPHTFAEIADYVVKQEQRDHEMKRVPKAPSFAHFG